MQEQATNAFYDFMYGKFLLKDYFDITMHEDDYVERAYNTWRDIGNIATVLHSIPISIDSSCLIKLPCNVEMIEAVSEGLHWPENHGEFFHASYGDPIITNPNSFLADALVRSSNCVPLTGQHSQLHAKGEYIPYELVGTPGNYSLRFDPKFVGIEAVCIYNGICVDEDGNPLLTRKEAEAIAYKLAFIETQKKTFMGHKDAAQILSYIKQESSTKMAAARIAEYMTQNEWNRILSAKTRHDRKVFWSSYKLMQ